VVVAAAAVAAAGGAGSRRTHSHRLKTRTRVPHGIRVRAAHRAGRLAAHCAAGRPDPCQAALRSLGFTSQRFTTAQ
jgi:hypothetical protein